MILKHNCSECENEYQIEYDEETAPDDPCYCPFCGEYMVTELASEDD